MLSAQTLMELNLTLRRGESVLLTLIIPVGLLLFFTKVNLLPDEKVLGGRPVDFVTPGVLALAVLSTAFTGQAIATGFERCYGVLKRLGASALPRWVLLLGKTLGVLGVEILQIAGARRGGLRAGLAPARQSAGRAPAADRGNGRVLGTGPADGRHPARRGDPCRRQRRLPDLPAARRHRLPALPLARARCRASPRCCPAPPSPRGCAASWKPAPPCPGATSACSPSGPPSPASSPPATSAGNNKINAPMIWFGASQTAQTMIMGSVDLGHGRRSAAVPRRLRLGTQ